MLMPKRVKHRKQFRGSMRGKATRGCLLYTSDAADDLLCEDIGGRRNIKKKKKRTVRMYESKG